MRIRFVSNWPCLLLRTPEAIHFSFSFPFLIFLAPLKVELWPRLVLLALLEECATYQGW